MMPETDADFIARMREVFERGDEALREILDPEPSEETQRFYQSGEIDRHFESEGYPL